MFRRKAAVDKWILANVAQTKHMVKHKNLHDKNTDSTWLSGGSEGTKELGVSIFPLYFPFNGEPRSYLEFPNHLIDASCFSF